jgi:hypothetical protein
MKDKTIIVSKINSKINKFYDKAYGKKHILHNLEHVKWQFKDNPFYKDSNFSLVIVEDENKIKSHLGFIPVQLKILNETIPAIWHVSFYTLDEFRGKKLGTKTIELSNTYGDVSMVLSGSEGTKKIYTNMDGKDLGLLNRYIRILNKNNLEKYGNVKINIKNINMHNSNVGKLSRVKNLNYKYKEFWNIVKNRYPITVNRTEEYLNWRYFNHPIIDYHFMEFIVNDELKGFVVIRLEDNNEEVKAARLVDIICKKTYDVDIFNHIITYCKNKVDFIDFFCTGKFYQEGLEDTGFIKDDKNELKIPTVFNPIDFNRRQNMNFFYSNNRKNNYKIDLNEINNWYLVKSDSDQDRGN